MSYKVLYRKYRPNTFGEIVSQKTIVDNLKNSIKTGTFSHAYIFTGPRGTGKTSTAKVLAKAINCTNNSSGEACGNCKNCQSFQTSPDIIEIDAASNNGVDEIRELRSNITLAPAESKYKIYIIDEVHMLSPGAFNALLKTLEEPPAHAIFILATTEVYKVPITILSRCQRYDFKKIEKNELIEHLQNICSKEKIEYEADALEEIYSLSEGCLRDALSILDQTAKSKKKIILEDILNEYNIISSNSIKILLDKIVKNDIMGIITQLEEYENKGMNAQKLIKRLINYLEKTAIDIKLGTEKSFKFEIIDRLINSLNKCYIDARINENVFTMIKLCFLEVLEPNTTEKNRDKNATKLLTETKKTADESSAGEKSPPNVDKKIEKKDTTIKPMNIIDIRINNCFVEVKKEALKELTEFWKNIDGNLFNSINPKDYNPVASSNSYAIFSAEEESLAKLFNIKSDEVEKILKKRIRPLKIVAITSKKWNAEKEKYKENIKNKKTYEYMEEPLKKDDSKRFKDQANDLFTENIIEIS